jgi:deferrochelatase/peroxidase EfeB
MQLSDADFGDIQGLVRFGHRHLKSAQFVLAHVADPIAARRWLAAKAAPPMGAVDPLAVTTAVKIELPDAALQVAFTHHGLVKLGVSLSVLKDFASEFRFGMSEKNRARRLGDVGRNDPACWDWGGAGNVPHVLVMLYARPCKFDALAADLESQLLASGFSNLKIRTTHDMHDVEPFGFADGISQPEIDWAREKPVRSRITTDYTNMAALGEFLLGYPNEYGKYTDRPLLDPHDDPKGILPLAEDRPGKRDFGRNGTFLVVRDLQQHVRRFWQFIDREAGPTPHQRAILAHSMVGRTIAGDPIVRLRERPIPGVGRDTQDVWYNQFTFEDDPAGTTCPFGAHVRRANPRNPDVPYGSDNFAIRLLRLIGFDGRGPHDGVPASTRFHRILRRGREYGTRLTPEEAIASDAQDDVDERGLRFMCLNASILRQFEFVQSSWLASSKFDALTGESDPLVGNRLPLANGSVTDGFTLPREGGLPRHLCGLQQFVTVRGGAYFFLPGMSALRYIAR